MAAVIRMKRHISDEPCTENFILNCKRKKLNESMKSEFSFAGTVSKNADISEHISKITKTDAKEIILKKYNPGSRALSGRVATNKEKSQNNRFKIVNYTRALEEGATDDNKLTIVDVEKEQACEASTSTQSSLPQEFVYDLYVSEANEMDYPEDMNDLSIIEYSDYLYACPRDANEDSQDDQDSSEDSNDEDNWRNDYPEEDDDESVGENAMRRAMDNFDIDNDLSTDDEDKSERLSNHFVHTIDSEAVGFENDIDSCDVDRYGTAYAAYKSRVIKKMNLSGSDQKNKALQDGEEEDSGDSNDETNKDYYYD